MSELSTSKNNDNNMKSIFDNAFSVTESDFESVSDSVSVSESKSVSDSKIICEECENKGLNKCYCVPCYYCDKNDPCMKCGVNYCSRCL